MGGKAEKRKMFLVETEAGGIIALFTTSHTASNYADAANRKAGTRIVRPRHEWCDVIIKRPGVAKRRRAS